MTRVAPRIRGLLSRVCLGACALTLLAGCSVYNGIFHRSRDHGCSEKPFAGNTTNLPGLTVPEGMTPPDARNQVKIPALNEPERKRAKTEPCLSHPPSYASGSSIAVPVRSGTPMGAPAPAPVPISPVQPGPLEPEPPVLPAPPIEPAPPAAPAPTTPAPTTPAPPTVPASPAVP